MSGPHLLIRVYTTHAISDSLWCVSEVPLSRMALTGFLMILPSLENLVTGPIQANAILQSQLLLFIGT
jgi:hypothetical protein